MFGCRKHDPCHICTCNCHSYRILTIVLRDCGTPFQTPLSFLSKCVHLLSIPPYKCRRKNLRSLYSLRRYYSQETVHCSHIHQRQHILDPLQYSENWRLEHSLMHIHICMIPQCFCKRDLNGKHLQTGTHPNHCILHSLDSEN